MMVMPDEYLVVFKCIRLREVQENRIGISDGKPDVRTQKKQSNYRLLFFGCCVQWVCLLFQFAFGVGIISRNAGSTVDGHASIDRDGISFSDKFQFCTAV